MTLNRTFARFPFVVAAALVTTTSFALTAPANAAETSAAGTATVAATATQGAAGEQAAATVDKNKKICVYERLTGSRMKQQICKTAAQWAAEK